MAWLAQRVRRRISTLISAWRSTWVSVRWRRIGVWLAAIVLLSGLTLDRLFPLPAPGHASFNVIVIARDGTPLRAFPDREHVWRYPVKPDQVSPYYVETLLAYEDRYFWWHPGINPFSLLRATYQWLRYGHIVSGGSTLTMQVARILDPIPRTIPGKLRQLLRALQLELHYSKKEILNLYMNFAPMGGVLEGVEAGSRAYLGKPAKRLTHAEAALLTVLPQLPSVLRPDRYPQKALLARDKVLRRMQRSWTTADIRDALNEPIFALSFKQPLLAPLLAERLKKRYPGTLKIDTTIDSNAQQTVETLLLDRVTILPPRISMAAMVMDNHTGEVIAYAGSADFTDRQRFSDVDMIQASRSPGSTLKPFLYGFALDEGLIHSESLLSDTPQSFGGYQPGNFQQNFHGPVSVSEALSRSLNVPAVEVLDQLGPNPFVSMLRRGGLKLEFPKGATPNLSVILGGAGAKLEDMIAAYSSLARKGMAITPRFVPADPHQERRMMSEGAAFIVRDILETGGPLGRAIEVNGAYRGIAWKTGTSFGFRDAWALGVTQRYTAGVWVGRPDGTPNPGFFGANVAAPLLVDIVNALPGGRNQSPALKPVSVTEETICWPAGTRAEVSSTGTSTGSDNKNNAGATRNQAVNPDTCSLQRTAWVLNGIAPPTFADRLQSISPRITYYIDQQTGQRVLPDCARHPFLQKQLVRWPASLEPWLDSSMRKRSMPPEWDSSCAAYSLTDYSEGNTIQIMGLNDGELIHRTNTSEIPQARLELRGQHGAVSWLVNGRLLPDKGSSTLIKFTENGRYDITAFDTEGRTSRISVSVQLH